MNHKFTSDGRKVAVVGALNAKETIVQEVFVRDGTEFPAGEHFVVKTLLDAPALTYKAKEEQRVIENIERLERERNRLETEIKGFKFKSQAATAKLKWISGVTSNEVQEVFDNLIAMMTGEYTHVVLSGSGEIKEWGHELFTNCDSYNRSFESLRLISLFGEWNGRQSLGWKVNQYQDGSGISTVFFPCRSFQEAVEKAKEIVYIKEHLSDDSYTLCLKYGIPVDEAKNSARLAGKANCIRKQIQDSRDRIVKLEADLAAVA
jgi:hypothetical protein